MKKIGFVFVSALAMFAGIALAEWLGVEVKDEDSNVVARGLKGKWILDQTLTKRLYGNPDFIPSSFEFTIDHAVAKKIPAGDNSIYKNFLQDRQAYTAGIMSMNDKDYPFILISLAGCSHLVYFRERDGDPMGDAESFYVMFANGTQKANDMLFMGGDSPDEPFTAYIRAK